MFLGRFWLLLLINKYINHVLNDSNILSSFLFLLWFYTNVSFRNSSSFCRKWYLSCLTPFTGAMYCVCLSIMSFNFQCNSCQQMVNYVRVGKFNKSPPEIELSCRTYIGHPYRFPMFCCHVVCKSKLVFLINSLFDVFVGGSLSKARHQRDIGKAHAQNFQSRLIFWVSGDEERVDLIWVFHLTCYVFIYLGTATLICSQYVSHPPLSTSLLAIAMIEWWRDWLLIAYTWELQYTFSYKTPAPNHCEMKYYFSQNTLLTLEKY